MSTSALDGALQGRGGNGHHGIHLTAARRPALQGWPLAGRGYQDSVALGDRGPWLLVQLARCRLRLGDVDGAQGAGSQAVERDPDSSSAWVALGDVAVMEMAKWLPVPW